LRAVEVIAQVDHKFILAKVPTNTEANGDSHNTCLLIVDQHAADERCRVEALMRDYFVVEPVMVKDVQKLNQTHTQRTLRACTELLEKPLKFDISHQDATQLLHALKFFEYWGISYQIIYPQLAPTGSKAKAAVCLEVTKLPPSIVERCRLEPRLLIELLRKEAWRLDEDGRGAIHTPNSNHTSDISELHWLSRFHGCPQGILDMLNSRACRSAIMFNDHISHEDCVDLLERLAECTFPFQCAHGRPSMIPLLHLGYDEVGDTSNVITKNSFARSFKTWKSSTEE
jgi:DNA mismatch repair protein MLH3